MFVVVEVRQYQLENDDDYELNKFDNKGNFEMIELIFDQLNDKKNVTQDCIFHVKISNQIK